MLEEVKQSYTQIAKRISDWQTRDKNELINLAIDHENDSYWGPAYLSAVILRYWPNIGKHYNNSKSSGFSIEDCYDMVLDAITYVLRKRKWRDPENPYFNDKQAPDKMMNRCIYSARQLRYYLSNRDKRKANFGQVRLDEIIENVGDHTDILMDEDDIEDSSASALMRNIDLEAFLKSYLSDKDKILYGLIMHYVIFSDCFNTKVETVKTESMKYKRYTDNFKFNKLITNLLSSKSEDIRFISKKYRVIEEPIKQVIDYLHSIPEVKAKKIIKSAIENMAKDNRLKECLCY